MRMKNKKPTIIIDRETGDKLKEFHTEVSDFIDKINEKFSLNYYEMIGVLETIIWGLHEDAFNYEEEEE